MIYEFAVEPAAVALWGEANLYRYFSDKFGLGHPRIISVFPSVSRWRREVLNAAGISDSENEDPSIGDLDLPRLLAMVDLLLETHIARAHVPFNNGKSWLANAEIAALRYPFQGIVAREKPRSNNPVLLAESLGLEPNEAWDVRSATTPGRTALDLATALSPMLRCAREIVFVDPYFHAQDVKRREIIGAFLTEVIRNRPCASPTRIDILVSGDKKLATFDYFKNGIVSKMPRHIPRGTAARFIRLKKRQGGEELHNRYVLTNLGGVKLGNSLNEGGAGETDDANLMDREQYLLRWSQYVEPMTEFEIEAQAVQVMGTA